MPSRHRLSLGIVAAAILTVVPLAAVTAEAAVSDQRVYGDIAADTDPATTTTCPAGTLPRGLRVTSGVFVGSVRVLCGPGAGSAGLVASPGADAAGTSQDLVCPDRGLLTGVQANTGYIVDAIGPVCSATRTEVGVPAGMSSGTGGYDFAQIARCAPGDGVGGLLVATKPNFNGEVTVSSASLQCAPLQLPSTLTKTTSGLLQLRPAARLTDTATRLPLAGRTIRFSNGCTATTSANGVATCGLNVSVGAISAAFAGDDTYLPAKARS